MKRHDWRLLPVATAAWVGAWIGTAGWVPERAGWLAALSALLLVAVVAWRSGRIWLAVVMMVLTVTLLASGMRSWQRHSTHVAALAERASTATVEFTVTAEPTQRKGVVVGAARLSTAQSQGTRVTSDVPVVILASGPVGADVLRMVPGARYRATARIGPAERSAPEAVVLSLRSLHGETAEPDALRSLAHAMRRGLRDSMGLSPTAQAALVPSLVVGDTSRVDEEMRRDFQATGLTHLMAVSGAKVTNADGSEQSRAHRA